MAKMQMLAGATSQSVNIFVQNSSLTTGAGLTGLVFNSSGLKAYYTFTGTNTTATSITLATLAAVNSAFSSGGFKEIDSTNMPGLYRFDLPNASLATASGQTVAVMLSGATNMAPVVLEIELIAWNNQVASLPNAVAGASGGLLISGSNSGTTTLGALTCTGTFTVSDGISVSRSTANSAAVTFSGNGSGNGLTISGGAGATTTAGGIGLSITGGTGGTTGASAAGMKVVGGAAGSTSGNASAAILLTGGAAAAGTGNGAAAISATGGAASSTAQAGDGVDITGGVAAAGEMAGIGLNVTGGAAVTSGPAGAGVSFTGGVAANNAAGTAGAGMIVTGGNASTAGAAGVGISVVGGQGSASTSGPGAGMTISGGNANTATAVATGLSVTGTSQGHGFAATGGVTSGHGIFGQANGGAHGIYGLSGTGASGDGIRGLAQSTNGNGALFYGSGTGHGIDAESGVGTTGNGLNCVARSTNGNGLVATGTGTGAGYIATGGATGPGESLVGGATSGDGLKVTTTSGHGFNITATGTSKHGILATGAAAATTNAGGNGLNCVGGASTTSAGGTAGVGFNVLGGAGSASTNGAASGATFAGGGTNTVASAAIGFSVTGTSLGAGLNAQSGTGATGNGINAQSNATNGNGIFVSANGTNAGISTQGGSTSGAGMAILAGGTGNGLTITGGNASGATAAGTGLSVTGGTASTTGGGVAGVGMNITGGSGAASTNGAASGLSLNGGGTNTVASTASALIATGTSNGDGFQLIGAGTGFDLLANTNGLNTTGTCAANVTKWNGTAVATPATAGIPDVNAKNVNNVSTSSVTTVNANLGTTQVLTFDANNLLKTDIEDWKGGAVPATNVSGVPLVDTKYLLGTIFSTPATAGIMDVNVKNMNNVSGSSITTINANQGTTQPVNFTGTGASALCKSDMQDIAGAAVSTATAQLGVNLVNWNGTAASSTVPPDTVMIRSGTAQGGGSSTITLDAGASSTNNLYQDQVCYIRSGTGAGQSNVIMSYVGSTKVATMANAWAVTPDNTSVFTILAIGPSIATATVMGTVAANVTQWNGTNVSAPATAGIPDVNVKNYNNQTASTDANNFPKVDVEAWKAGLVPATNVTGVPLTDDKYLLGTIYSTPATAGIMDVNIKNIKNTVTAGIAGYVGLDWSAINAPTTTLDLSGTTIKNLDGNTVQTGDAFARLGAPAGASIAADIAEIEGETDTLLSGVNCTQLAGQNVTAASGVTFPGTIASPTNITAGTLTTVTNLTNAPTSGDFTSTMKTSLNNATPASVTGAVGSVTGNVGGNVAGSVNSVVGAVTVGAVNSSASAIKKNTALSNFELVMTDNIQHQPVTGLTVTAQRSLDGASFANCANSVTEVGSGVYVINLASTDMNATVVTLKFTATGADTRLLTIITQP